MNDSRTWMSLSMLFLVVLLLQCRGPGPAVVTLVLSPIPPTSMSTATPVSTPTLMPTMTPTPTESPTPTVTPTPTEILLLPDLVAISPQVVYIQFQGDLRFLRFDTSFANVGTGPLHIFGEKDPEQEIVRAIQTLFTASGEERSEEIGEFTFNPKHAHWHLEEFARYELWSYSEEGAQEELLMNGEKVSFCMFDSNPHNLALPNAPQESQYVGCDENIQGLSVGWMDTYRPSLAGQLFNITGYPDGRYHLKIILNPAHHIVESNFGNNEAVILLQVAGDTVLILEE